jgi:hypothetical protein
MSEEIQTYCCLPFSYAVHFGLITIDTESIVVEIRLHSTFTDSRKKEIWDKLYKQQITNITADFFQIIHCPWCGIHLSTVIDFDKGSHAGQYSSKAGWER